MSTAVEEVLAEEPLPPPTRGAMIRAPAAEGALIRPAAQIEELLKVHDEIVELANKLLKEGRDYGAVPGTERKTLLKPGAERMNFAFGVMPVYQILEREADHDREVQWTKRKKEWYTDPEGKRTFDWKEESGTSRGVYRYVVKCSLLRRSDGALVAEGIGVCSTLEGKYTDRPRELENTVLKLSEKRSYVAATLNAYALSDRFTQDAEEEEAPAPQKVRRYAKPAAAAAARPGEKPSILAGVEAKQHDDPQTVAEWREALLWGLEQAAPGDPQMQAALLQQLGSFENKNQPGQMIVPQALAKMTLKWCQGTMRKLQEHLDHQRTAGQPLPETEEEAAEQSGLRFPGEEPPPETALDRLREKYEGGEYE